MNKVFPVAMTIVAALGMAPAANARENFYSCPKPVEFDIASRLPSSWWSTPVMFSRVSNTLIQTIAGDRTLVCEYKSSSNTYSVMKKQPAGMSCRAEQSGFRCSTSSSSSGKSTKSNSGGSSSSSSSQSKPSTSSSSSKPKTSSSSGSGRQSCPDLAFVRVFVEQVGPDRGNGTHDVVLVAAVSNQGTANYDSQPNQQQISIYEVPPGGSARQVAIEGIGGYRAGKMLKGESGGIRYTLKNWRVSDEFPPSYRFQLVFDPDIRQDGNTLNDDCNSKNNQMTISGSAINKAIRSGVR